MADEKDLAQGKLNEESQTDAAIAVEDAEAPPEAPEGAVPDGESEATADDSGNVGSADPAVKAAQFSELATTEPNAGESAMDRVLDVTVKVSVELGRTEMSIQDIMSVGVGSVVELGRRAGEPVDLLLNGNVLARGEVVVVEENFGIRITSMEGAEVNVETLG